MSADPDPTPADGVVADESSLELAELAEAAERPFASRRFPRHRVRAVLVAHDGLPWLERSLDAVAAQTRPPQQLLVADTGSTDGTAELLAARVGPGVLTLPRDTGFGAAVAQALRGTDGGDGGAQPEPDRDHDRDHDPHDATDEQPEATGPVVEWVWLLHDDCAPEPDALGRLLAAVDSAPSVGIVGPKVVGWADPRHLLEVGVTIARSGSRDTGLERNEQDQGQHDAQRSVLAVSTAGMLVRRDVWDELGGLDPRFPLFRDDVDLGWRANAAGHRVLVAPAAVVHHAEAASHRRRRISVGPDQPHRLDRTHAMQVLLANMPAWALPWVVLRLTVGALLRALGFLIGKDPGFALAEVRALGSTLAHPRVVLAARRSRRATRRVGYGDLRGLLAAPGTQLRHGLEILGTVFATDARRPSRIGVRAAPADASGAAPPDATAQREPAVDEPSGSGSPTDDGDDDEPQDLLAGADGVLRRTLRRPGVQLVLVALVVTLVAERALLSGGSLLGGALLPSTGGASGLWSTYVAWWHPVGVGSGTPAAPYAPLLAVASLVLLGKVALLVDLVVLLCVPLAAVTAYLSLRGLVRSVTLRVWAAATYVLLPAATGAIATGRVGTALVLVLLPVLARPALRLAGVVEPEATWRTAWGTGLALALLAAFVPGLWVLALALAVVAAATTARGRASALRLGAALLVSPLVLVPWTWQLVRHPAYLLVEAGVVTSSAAPVRPHPLAVLLLAPGGPGTPQVWVGLGLVLAAAVAVVRGHRARAVTVGVAVALVAVLLAAVLAATHVRTPQLSAAVPAWSGTLLVVAAAGLLAAAVLGAEGGRDRLVGQSFGWRQPVAVVVVALCVLGPAVAAAHWVSRGAGDPVRRAAPSVLPAFVSADGASPAQTRALALRYEPGTDQVAYSLLRDDGLRLGDAEVAPAAAATPALPTVVSDLTSGRGGAAGLALVAYGVRYVVVGAPVPDELGRALDGAPGLRRFSADSTSEVWRVVGPTGRVRFVPSKGAPAVLPSGPVSVDTTLPAGSPAGVLELAEASAHGWHATLGGRTLAPTVVDGWAQGFRVPAGGGALRVEYRDPARGWWLALEALLVVVVAVLALPARRREGEGEDA